MSSAKQLASEYGVEYGKSVLLPVGTKLAKFNKNEAPGHWPFCELVGSLTWLATQTRPDISNAMRVVAGYWSAPKSVHWRVALGILGYVRRTSGFGITFQRCTVGVLSLQVFVDADYASVAADRRSVSGELVMCDGACEFWFSRTQKCITLSTTEAEYVALADVMKEVLFLRQVWRFMLPAVGMLCTPVFENNEGAVQLAQNPITNSNSKHIPQVAGREEREIDNSRAVPVSACNFLTKAIARDSFEFHRNLAMS